MRFTSFVVAAFAIASATAGPILMTRVLASEVTDAIKHIAVGYWPDESVKVLLAAVKEGDKHAIGALNHAMKNAPPGTLNDMGSTPMADVLYKKFETEGAGFLDDFKPKSSNDLKSSLSSSGDLTSSLSSSGELDTAAGAVGKQAKPKSSWKNRFTSLFRSKSERRNTEPLEGLD